MGETQFCHQNHIEVDIMRFVSPISDRYGESEDTDFPDIQQLKRFMYNSANLRILKLDGKRILMNRSGSLGLDQSSVDKYLKRV